MRVALTNSMTVAAAAREACKRNVQSRLLMLQVGTAWLGAIKSAGFVLGAYSSWLIGFERWIEPAVRRGVGAIAGCCIVWLPAGGPFRIWGSQNQGPLGIETALGFLCSLVILIAAVLPACALVVIASGQTSDAAVQATIYLITLPMIGVFVTRMLWREET
jgi:hypothetical protein